MTSWAGVCQAGRQETPAECPGVSASSASARSWSAWQSPCLKAVCTSRRSQSLGSPWSSKDAGSGDGSLVQTSGCLRCMRCRHFWPRPCRHWQPCARSPKRGRATVPGNHVQGSLVFGNPSALSHHQPHKMPARPWRLVNVAWDKGR